MTSHEERRRERFLTSSTINKRNFTGAPSAEESIGQELTKSICNEDLRNFGTLMDDRR
jgi:hypothetical protein